MPNPSDPEPRTTLQIGEDGICGGRGLAYFTFDSVFKDPH